MMLTKQQKALILNVLKKEQKRLFSKNKGKLLDKTVDDIAQMLRNEIVNDPNDKSLDWNTKEKILR